ncbi:hypothetical protein ACFQ22_01775 [Lentilactobacillus raoultii]|uniref:DNA-directed RNA polymerase beta subunit n=1 Tax=Lentilactobacillus raoultii TaxID=1987503 RepID=A0ABW3PGM9_9LACO|nr:hypothetical protein [Lentilactobacillus raoultii]
MDVVNHFFEHDYRDRGMLKWQGFYLSDHTAALNHQRDQQQRIYQRQPQQTLPTISKLLADAYQRHRQVTLQLNEVDLNGRQLPDSQTYIYGYHDDRIVIDDQKLIAINQIRHVTLK